MVLALLTAAAAQEPIRVSVTLVQVDAIVTDRQGKPVTNLKSANFELFENGKRRDLDGVTFVSGNPEGTPAGGVAGGTLRREDVGRTLAFVVDDTRMQQENLEETRKALGTFVDRQMRANDMVAIIAVSGNLGSLQRFTNDKALLKSAVAKLRMDFQSNMRFDRFDPTTLQRISGLVNRRLILSTLGSLRATFEAMRPMPGRKAVVVFMEGLQIQMMTDAAAGLVFETARSVTEAASRSSIVIYPVDPRGPQPVMYGNAAAISELNAQGTRQRDLDRLAIRMQQARDGLNYLADETGGLAVYDDNDVSDAVSRVLRDHSGHYLLSFRRGPDSKPGEALRKLTVKLKDAGPGLRIRYRRSYLGEGDGAAAQVTDAKPLSPGEKLRKTLLSTFAESEGIGLRLTPQFTLDPGLRTPVIRGLVHIDGKALKFDDKRSAALQFAARVENPDGRIEMHEKAFTMALPDDAAVAKARRDGLIYIFEHPVTAPGGYHLRVAVLDALSQATGWTGQFVEIPPYSPGKSNVVGSLSMTAGDMRQAPPSAADADLSSATRIFRVDQPFSFGLTIHHPTPGLAMQAAILRAGGDKVEPVWTGRRNPIPVAAAGGNAQDAAAAVPAGGVLSFNGKLPPGNYTFEVRLFRGDDKIGLQQLDFTFVSPPIPQ
jgi:VWFA-related protein